MHKNDIPEFLKRIRMAGLSDYEKQHVWEGVEGHRKPAPVPPTTWLTQQPMIPALAVLLIVALGGGTVAAADSARPGDFLFGVDRAVEEVRLRLTIDDEKKNELRIRFAEERLEEVDSLGASATSTTQSTATSTATTTPSDSGRKDRVEVGLELAARILADISERVSNETAQERLAAVVQKLNARIDALEEGDRQLLHEKIRIRFEDRDPETQRKSRVDIRINNDEIRIKVKDHSKDDDDEDDRDDHVQTGTTTQAFSLEIEAEVFTDTTVVKVELNDRKSTFTTQATTTEAIADAVLSRFPTLTRAQIVGALEVEVEDRASSGDSKKEKGERKNDDDDEDHNRGGRDSDDDDDKRGKDTTTQATSTTTTTFTLAQIAQHNTAVDCYTTINGSVYDLTGWIAKHPGGEAAILALCGIDGTTAFNGQHGGGSKQATILAGFKIGILAP